MTEIPTLLGLWKNVLSIEIMYEGKMQFLHNFSENYGEFLLAITNLIQYKIINQKN